MSRLIFTRRNTRAEISIYVAAAVMVIYLVATAVLLSWTAYTIMNGQP